MAQRLSFLRATVIEQRTERGLVEVRRAAAIKIASWCASWHSMPDIPSKEFLGRYIRQNKTAATTAASTYIGLVWPTVLYTRGCISMASPAWGKMCTSGCCHEDCWYVTTSARHLEAMQPKRVQSRRHVDVI